MKLTTLLKTLGFGLLFSFGVSTIPLFAEYDELESPEMGIPTLGEDSELPPLPMDGTGTEDELETPGRESVNPMDDEDPMNDRID